MGFYAGTLWSDGAPSPYWIEESNGRVRRHGKGSPPKPSRPSVLLDGLSDFHAHLADAALAGHRIPRDLAKAVEPPRGMKHRLLAATPPSEVRDATVRRLRVLARVGVRRILEFREQGPAGVARSRAAARAAGFPGLLIFGRPAATPSMDGERRRLARLGDGIGISSLRDVGRAEFGALSRAAHDAGKPFAVHVSEGVREPIDVVLAARPDLLIHACAASSGDLEVVARRRVPLVFCPTSNRHFRLRPPIAAAERLGIAWYLGTDNAMLASPGPLYEARLARRLVPGLPDASLLRALTTSPKKALKNVAPVERASASHSLVVLPTSRTGGVRWNARERVLRW